MRGRAVGCVLWLLPLGCLVLSLGIGAFPLPVRDMAHLALEALTGDGASAAHIPDAARAVFFQVRLPRVLAAMCIGGGLAVSGAVFQGVFRNPLVSPFILGVASGAGFGAALGILYGTHPSAVQAGAVTFGILAVLAAFGLARLYRVRQTLVLVLAGVIVGAFFNAALSLLKYVADPEDKLPVIVYWLMGSLASLGQRELASAAPPILVCLALLLTLRWRLNLLTLDDDEARSLGVATGPLRVLVVAAATIITACAVSVSGIIGWVGLVIPHLARMLAGPDFTRLLPACLSLGACYLVLIDDLARTAVTGEIPLGIFTATIGAPVFALVLRRASLGWSGS